MRVGEEGNGNQERMFTMACTAQIRPRALTDPRSAADLHLLFREWQQEGDDRAREALVRRFTPLARGLARRYERSSEPLDDLLQVAMLGLLKAIDRFDLDRGTAFASFAVPTILGEMRRYFRDCGWGVHVPRGLQERALKVGEARQTLTSDLGRSPTVGELATYLELSIEEVGEALQTARAYDMVSLDAPRGGEEDDSGSLGESIGRTDSRYELVELDATICGALGELPKRERRILHMRFVEELTQTQIAQRVGISQMQVSRLLRRSLERVRLLTDA